MVLTIYMQVCSLTPHAEEAAFSHLDHHPHCRSHPRLHQGLSGDRPSCTLPTDTAEAWAAAAFPPSFPLVLRLFTSFRGLIKSAAGVSSAHRAPSHTALFLGGRPMTCRGSAFISNDADISTHFLTSDPMAILCPRHRGHSFNLRPRT